MARVRHWAIRFGLAVTGLFGLAGLLLALAYLALQSEGGRDWAAKRIESLATTPGSFELRIDGLDGRLPFEVSAREIALGDAAGTWLTVEAAHFEIDPAALLDSALLDSALRFRVLEAERIRWDRLPEAGDSEARESDPVPLPRLPFAIRLQRISVGEVALGPEVLGEAAAFRIDGAATSEDGSAVEASLRLERSDGTAGRAAASLRYGFAEAELDLEAEVDEPAGGLIVRAMGFEDLPALKAELAGAGPLSDWAGILAVNLEGLARGEAALTLRGREETLVSAEGNLTPMQAFEDLPWRLANGGLRFEAEALWRGPATLVLHRSRLTAPAADLALTGTFDLEAETLEAEALAELADAEVLRPDLPGAQATGLALTAQAEGSFYAPEIAATATGQSFAVEGFALDAFTASLEADGPLERPRLALDFEAGRVAMTGAAAGEVSAKARFTPEDTFDWEHPIGRVTAAGSLGALDLSALGEAAPALGRRLTWDLRALLDLPADEAREGIFTLETEHGRLTGLGDFAWESGTTDVRLCSTTATWQP